MLETLYIIGALYICFVLFPKMHSSTKFTPFDQLCLLIAILFYFPLVVLVLIFDQINNPK